MVCVCYVYVYIERDKKEEEEQEELNGGEATLNSDCGKKISMK